MMQGRRTSGERIQGQGRDPGKKGRGGNTGGERGGRGN